MAPASAAGALDHRTRYPPATTPLLQPSGTAPVATLVLGGDLALHRWTTPHDSNALLAGLASVTGSADACIVNLESQLTSITAPVGTIGSSPRRSRRSSCSCIEAASGRCTRSARCGTWRARTRTRGAHLVVCHHAHIPMGVEVWRGAVIAPGLGNLYFGASSRQLHPHRNAWFVLRVGVATGAVTTAELVPIGTDRFGRAGQDTGTGAQAAALLADLRDRASELISTADSHEGAATDSVLAPPAASSAHRPGALSGASHRLRRRLARLERAVSIDQMDLPLIEEVALAWGNAGYAGDAGFLLELARSAWTGRTGPWIAGAGFRPSWQR